MADIDTALAGFGLVVGATAVAGAAGRLRVPAPILLVVTGLAVSFLPFVPDYTLNPDLVLLLVLPPLLYSAALESSYIGIRTNLRPIGLLSVGLVLATTLAVGLVAHAVIPGLPLAAAFALGALVAPPDAVAAAAVGRELGLPRRVLTILGGESLFNDATALTALRVAVAAAAGGGISLLGGAETFLLAAGGGAALGLLLAVALHWVRRRLTEPVLENSLSLFTPFVVYLLAESIHASGVLAVVVVGLYLGHHESATSYATRLQSRAIWRMIDFLLESVVFALIGLQLPVVVAGLDGRSPWQLAGYAALILGVVIVVRIAWIFPFSFLAGWQARRVDRSDRPTWKGPAVVSWAGMRGVVSLAAAFALAGDFPARELILFLTFAVVLGTLVVQGMTLPWVVRGLRIGGEEQHGDLLAEANAQHRAARAAVERLEALVAAGEGRPPPDTVVDRLRNLAEGRSLGAWERVGGGTGQDGDETPSAAFRRLRQEMLRAEREVFVRMRDERTLDEEVLRRVVHELDLEEAMLERRSSR